MLLTKSKIKTSKNVKTHQTPATSIKSYKQHGQVTKNSVDTPNIEQEAPFHQSVQKKKRIISPTGCKLSVCIMCVYVFISSVLGTGLPLAVQARDTKKEDHTPGVFLYTHVLRSLPHLPPQDESVRKIRNSCLSLPGIEPEP